MTTKTANKFGWLDGILNRATKARDASELASIKDEAIQMAEKEGGVSDGDHTHIHLHPHSSGDTEMSGSAAPNPMPKPAPTPAANPTQKTSMTDSDRITALEEGHKKIQDTLQSICKALGVGENGEMEDDGDNEFDYNEQAEEGKGENFGDEANLQRLEPHYGRRENAGIYEASDYHEGEFVENDVERPFDGTKPIKRGFGAEAPPGSSSAINLADKRNRVGARDSSKNLRAEWQRMIADAEVIIPGVRIPTADSSNGLNIFSTMNNFKRRVLLRVSQDLNQAVDLENITGGRSIKNMTADGISTVFRSLAAVYRDRNNTGVLHMNTVGNLPGARGPAHGIQSIQDFQKKINNMADSVWGTGGSTR